MISNNRGFTLIELLITVGIVGILVSVAWPSYQESIAKSRRADARGQLIESAQFMQRYYSQNDRFDRDLAGVTVSLPVSLSTVPRGAGPGAESYLISFTSPPTISTFSIDAVPRVGGPMASDACGIFSLTSTGARSVSGTRSLTECWP
jgi:type IV pilus assembly protein PilE